eukprot:1123298-Amphidinium_carterae.1
MGLKFVVQARDTQLDSKSLAINKSLRVHVCGIRNCTQQLFLTYGSPNRRGLSARAAHLADAELVALGACCFGKVRRGGGDCPASCSSRLRNSASLSPHSVCNRLVNPPSSQLGAESRTLSLATRWMPQPNPTQENPLATTSYSQHKDRVNAEEMPRTLKKRDNWEMAARSTHQKNSDKARDENSNTNITRHG